MQGPFAIASLGDLTVAPPSKWEAARFVRGKRYRVTQPFNDADGDHHPAGEEWIFVGCSYSKTDDELILVVRLKSADWTIPLTEGDEDQKKVIDCPILYFIEL